MIPPDAFGALALGALGAFGGFGGFGSLAALARFSGLAGRSSTRVSEPLLDGAGADPDSLVLESVRASFLRLPNGIRTRPHVPTRPVPRRRQRAAVRGSCGRCGDR